MIHQSKIFVCPGQNYGISWNICISRQNTCFESCENCHYKNWQDKDDLNFNPFAGAFVDSAEDIDIEDEQYRYPDPKKINVFSAETRKLSPQDLGFVDNVTKKRNWIQRLYDVI